MKKRKSAWQKFLEDVEYRTITEEPGSKETKAFAIITFIMLFNAFLLMVLMVITRIIFDDAKHLLYSSYLLDFFCLNILGGTALSEWSMALIYRKEHRRSQPDQLRPTQSRCHQTNQYIIYDARH